MGFAFLIIAFASIFSHRAFLWWALFPAIVMISKGARVLVEAKRIHKTSHAEQRVPASYEVPLQAPPASYGDTRARKTGELIIPSVTENTTDLLK
jgi:hypothetical protein